MTPNEYQIAAARTLMTNVEQAKKLIDAVENSPRVAQLIVAGQKLSSESGELNDAIVKHTCYGQILDYENIIEECGDLLWYIAMILTCFDSTLEEAMQSNINKLKIRYPEKFTEKDAMERKDKQ